MSSHADGRNRRRGRRLRDRCIAFTAMLTPLPVASGRAAPTRPVARCRAPPLRRPAPAIPAAPRGCSLGRAQRRVGDDPDVHARSPRSRRISSERSEIVPSAREPAPRRRRAHQHVGAAERARDRDRDRRDVLALLDAQARPEHRDEPPQLLQRSAVLRARRTPGRAHDEHVELRVQALGRAPRAAHDALGLRRERRQREQPLGDRLRARLGRERAALPRRGARSPRAVGASRARGA